MFRSFLSNHQPELLGFSKKRRVLIAILLPLWVFLGFIAAQFLTIGLIQVCKHLGVSFSVLNETLLNACISAFVYLATLLIVIGIPQFTKKYPTTKNELGIGRLPRGTDVLAAPIGFIIYLVLSGILILFVGKIIPSFNADQTQSTGFTNLTQQYEYIAAFLTLVVIAPVAEEFLFRGYLFGKLRKIVPLWLAILITSALFAVIHGQWNVGLDVFVLSIIMCTLREFTGSIWTGVLIHMLKNGIAFYFLFISPLLMFAS